MQIFSIEMQEFVFRITDVKDCSAGHGTWAEFLDHSFDEWILPAWRNCHGLT